MSLSSLKKERKKETRVLKDIRNWSFLVKDIFKLFLYILDWSLADSKRRTAQPTILV